jgi:hypothetical protein
MLRQLPCSFSRIAATLTPFQNVNSHLGGVYEEYSRSAAGSETAGEAEEVILIVATRDAMVNWKPDPRVYIRPARDLSEKFHRDAVRV